MNSPRFSVNSNLMNYSIITHKSSVASLDKREIQRGDADTRIRQLEAQIEQLTLQNVKLQRINRLLKIDADNLLEQTTNPLYKTIEELTISNIKLQRTSRLLRQELDEKSEQMNKMQQNQILKMKSVGPEYEFLVQNINLLQRQIAGYPICDETCCFTMKPIDQSNMVMTIPAEEEDQEIEAQHICRPIIHSTISQGSYAAELEKRIHRLEQFIEDMEQEVESQQSVKENDLETLKRELRIKDDIVSQLEQDFMSLEKQIVHLHKELAISSEKSAINDMKRQSQLLKRRSLAVTDPELLEQLLKTDLHDEAVSLEGEEDTDVESRSSSPNNTVMYLEDNKKVKRHLLRVLP